MHLSKIVGYLFILSGCCGLGIWYSMRMQQKLWHIHEMAKILELTISEITYGRSTLPECCENIYERISEPYAGIFYEIFVRAQQETGDHFGDICREVMTVGMKTIPVDAEKNIFIRCFSDVGYSDEWMQKRNMERGRDELLVVLNTEEEEIKKKGRLAVSLGTMSGILLVLILL